MALLEEHGINRGKYKTGGIYEENISKIQIDRGLFSQEYSFAYHDTASILRCIEVDNNGSFYVGSTSGSNNIAKYDERTQTLIWELSTGSNNISEIFYDRWSDSIWVLEGTTRVSNYTSNGDLVLQIPANNTSIKTLAINSQYIFIAYNGASENIYIYNKDGTLHLTRPFNLVRGFAVDEEYMYVHYNQTFEKINFIGQSVFTKTTVGYTQPSSNARTDIIFDIDNNIYLYCFYSLNNVFNGAVYYFDQSGNNLLTPLNGNANAYFNRTSNEFSPGPLKINIHAASSGRAFNYQGGYPCSVSVDFGVLYARRLKPNGEVFAKAIGETSSEFVTGSQYKFAAMDNFGFIYVVFQKRIVKINSNVYNKIYK